METPITRYTVHPDEEPMYCVSVDAEGRYVDYDDHLAALAERDKKIEKAVRLLNRTTAYIDEDYLTILGDIAQFLKENDHG